MRQTYMAKPGDVQQDWHLIDAEGLVLGRLASKIAVLLMGKHKPSYTPHIDTGDFVVVVNAEKIKLTGRKAEQRFHKSFSGYPGGLKETPVGKVLKEHPERVLELAVRRMLPKNRSLGRQMLKKLKVYRGAEHPHAAQQPTAMTVVL